MDISSLSFGDRLGDLATFLMYGVLFMLAGGAAMTALDIAERIWLSGKVTRTQYLMALGVTFILGLFLQWEQAVREVAEFKKQSPSPDLQSSLHSSQEQIRIKDGQIQDLKRERDLLSVRYDSAHKEVEEFRHQLSGRDKKIHELERQLDDRAKKIAIREQLGRLLAEGEQLKLRARRDVNKPPPFKESDEWLNRVAAYLDKEVSHSDTVQFLNPPMLPSYSFGIPKEHENLVNALEPYLAVLRQLSRTYS